MKSILLAFLVVATHLAHAQNEFKVIAYYMGGPDKVASLPAEKLTHIIYSFCHLSGNKLSADSQKDSLAIQALVKLKERNPKLKVLLSLGGWGGCKTCSDVFSAETDRNEFAKSTLAMNQYFKTDGIDLDWEYPAVEGYPEHPFKDEDRDNFTSLVQQLRKTLGKDYEISFAAGGFKEYLQYAIDWELVMKEVDRVNVMSYDLVHGNSTATGHHTPLFSTPMQEGSAHRAVRYLVKQGVPRNKIVIGAAFYARMWEVESTFNDGLYQTAKFKKSINYHHFATEMTTATGFEFFWDENAMAPYAFNKEKKLFATFDDKRSIEEKTKYVIDQKLDGIMFWELSLDAENDGLLDVINKFKKPKTLAAGK